jgi:hypothetical protein
MRGDADRTKDKRMGSDWLLCYAFWLHAAHENKNIGAATTANPA